MKVEPDGTVVIDCKDEGWDGALYEKMWETGDHRAEHFAQLICYLYAAASRDDFPKVHLFSSRESG